ncbi:bifunctional ADP-dependent NAD(P)H-hydrate dehydratase/NAD(P)H-hydrate epimerase [Marinomonas sp. A3A]|uniref:NAD(P)H-hydrate dehydratase n=1 Tax=Marinomonas sp. A3A TaxID=2065312 RepID=UPI001BB2FE0B|nr:NAD(P)H-hydrate dehydratase [Marinomonas sp. A3A]QUX92576.1 bifunctional ADP-dependent NAD(P)H-hydrate dehydratase/NAD(P)H-hydrate epimerase [Marinomonas sp. A3A]
MVHIKQPQLLLTASEMGMADKAAVVAGVPAMDLMAAAGKAVADAVLNRWSKCSVLVLCGPGNNGGDGFVVAQLLRSVGWPVRLAFMGSVEKFSPEAKHFYQAWQGEVEEYSIDLLEQTDLVIDAMFGAGLIRPLEGKARDMVDAMIEREIPICAVDVPSGVDGTTGAAFGKVAAAELTVTFFRKKPGHLLFPGRGLCGEIVVADIGIPVTVLGELKLQTWENSPELWYRNYPWPRLDGHKFHRGHALVFGGENITGASRLTARGAMRMGAGLVTLAVPIKAWAVYATAMTSVMVAKLEQSQEAEDFEELLLDPRHNAIAVGPGAGLAGFESIRTRKIVMTALATNRATVLDADALSAFANDPQVLFDAITGPCVMTPHEGEFARLFLDVNKSHSDDKLTRARLAAKQSGAVVVLKGADTVIASHDGRAIINSNAPADLATGGSGDVLAGFIVGLLAQGVEPFYAAAAAVWLHGEVGNEVGAGLIAEDLPDHLPKVLAAFKRQYFSA